MARLRISPEFAIAAITSVGLHVVWLTHEAKASYLKDAPPAEVILEAESMPVPPPAPEPKAQPEPDNTPKPTQPMSARQDKADAKPALPAAAQAGRTLTAPDTASASDIADFSLVQGSGTEYVGGTTSSTGTSKAAVRGMAATKPMPAQPSTAMGGGMGALDRSRGAMPNGTDWNCSRLFPSDPNAPDFATVVIAVTVQTDGKPKTVTVIRDPGNGFAAAARSCAMMQTYRTAFDRTGSPMVGTTPPIVVRFTR